jgi:hypothetical protein
MSFNPIPLLLSPGLCICGYLLDEWSGVGMAGAAWASLMVVSTAFNAVFCPRCLEASLDVYRRRSANRADWSSSLTAG